MKKLYTVFFSVLLFSASTFGQIEDRLSYLLDSDVKQYVQPFVNSVSTALNSSMYHSASVSDLVGFSIGFQGMFVFVPDDQLRFTPTGLPAGYSADHNTATIFGGDGAYYNGPYGYITYPSGLEDVKNIPMIIPQIGISVLGTEALFRYFPKIDVGETNLGYFGIGIKHEISRYFPMLPLDIAAQVFYSKLEVEKYMTSKNLSINLIASKTFAILCVYGGLQIESSTMDLTYTFTDPNNIGIGERDINLSIDGDNSFRFTAGFALELGFFVLNADYGLGNQSVVNGGFSFEF